MKSSSIQFSPKLGRKYRFFINFRQNFQINVFSWDDGLNGGNFLLFQRIQTAYQRILHAIIKIVFHKNIIVTVMMIVKMDQMKKVVRNIVTQIHIFIVLQMIHAYNILLNVMGFTIVLMVWMKINVRPDNLSQILILKKIHSEYLNLFVNRMNSNV